MKQVNTIIIALLFSVIGYAQTKNYIDQPYIETQASVDTLVTPDRIYMTIILDEEDSKNKQSTEVLEQKMKKVLESLKIDIKKDVKLLDFNSDFKKYFLSSQKVLKTKVYSLKVTDAVTAGKVFIGLEKVGISNVSIEKVAFSQAENLVLQLKAKAMVKAQTNALYLLKPLNQKLGPAIFISDINYRANPMQGKVLGMSMRSAPNKYESEADIAPLDVDFDKIKFSAGVRVMFKIE